MVEDLLPYVWRADDIAALVGVQESELATPINASGDPRRVSDLWAAIADASRAWDIAPLSELQRRAVFMHYALALPVAAIAVAEGVSRQAVDERLFRAVGTLVATLNGTAFQPDPVEPQSQ